MPVDAYAPDDLVDGLRRSRTSFGSAVVVAPISVDELDPAKAIGSFVDGLGAGGRFGLGSDQATMYVTSVASGCAIYVKIAHLRGGGGESPDAPVSGGS